MADPKVKGLAAVAVVALVVVWLVYSQHGIHLRGCRRGYHAWEMAAWHALNMLSGGILGMVLYLDGGGGSDSASR